MPRVTTWSIGFYVSCLIGIASASTLAHPPQTALVVGFEDAYDLSLLANTLSDQGIDSTLIVSSSRKDIYEHLIDVELIKLDLDGSNDPLKACDTLISDQAILKRVREIRPTFTIFPAVRHDACLIPWSKYIESLPVIWAGDSDEELYAFYRTRFAIPVDPNGFFERIGRSMSSKSFASNLERDYVIPALRVVEKHLGTSNYNAENLYKDVSLVLWDADAILRRNFASVTESLVQVGCHHCRPVEPVPTDLQKQLVEYRFGTIAVFLDETYESSIEELARRLPSGRQGQAVVWKKDDFVARKGLPENLIVHQDVDRQDLIGYPRTRVLLSHCSDTEFLEAAYHGTPLICFPRDVHEERNAKRVVELEIGVALNAAASNEVIHETVQLVHESARYREEARKVSLAIRDKPLPVSDSVIYWLRHLARNQDNDKVVAVRRGKTYEEDLQFAVGLFVGVVSGVVVTVVAMLARMILSNERAQRNKGQYSR